jgi:glycosyltransferase involved in cell wall biosynthesis
LHNLTSLSDKISHFDQEDLKRCYDVTLIIPAYNEADNIKQVVYRIRRLFKDLPHSYEILIVDDGSSDSTLEDAIELSRRYENVRVFSNGRNMGKGYALKTGFWHSTGRIIIFIDADLEIPPELITSCLRLLEEQRADVVIGSKRHPKSSVNYPALRRLLSVAYMVLVRLLLGIRLKDTQFGLKVFRREALEVVMPYVLVQRYAFDAEILFNVIRRGFKVVEAPVTLDYRGKTKVNLRAIYNMLIDTLTIAYRAYIKRFYDGSLLISQVKYGADGE